MMGWYHDDGWSSWMVLVMLAWPLLIALAIWAVVALTPGGGRRSSTSMETPLQVLDRRLAAGDIDPDEYIQSRRLLENRSVMGPTTTGDA